MLICKNTEENIRENNDDELYLDLISVNYVCSKTSSYSAILNFSKAASQGVFIITKVNYSQV